jgi:putative nucleotidyltransferase with HDIG domain
MLPNLKLNQTINTLIAQYIIPLLGFVILVSTAPEWEPREHWSILFVFTLLTIIGAFAPVSTYNARLTVNNAVFFSGILLYGVWVAIWAAVIELLVVTFLSKSSPKKTVFNCGQILITLWLVGKLNDIFNALEIPWVLSDLLLIFSYWFTNLCLVASGISFFFHVEWYSTLKSMIRSGMTTYILLMVIGSIGARMVASYGISALIALVVAFILLSIVFRQYYHSLNQLQQKVEEVKSFNHKFLTAMAASIDARDHYTSGHSQRVAHWGREIAKAIGLPQEKVEEVYFGGILHDIGKIGIEDEILNKVGKLTPEEYDKIKQHTVIGYEIMQQAGLFNELLPAIRSHHERVDGRGYPDGLRGEEIPLVARILAISDAFDAMVADRPYRKGLPVEKALEEIRQGAGTQFDEKLADHFISIIDRLPKEELEAFIRQEEPKHRQLQEVFN